MDYMKQKRLTIKYNLFTIGKTEAMCIMSMGGDTTETVVIKRIFMTGDAGQYPRENILRVKEGLFVN